MRPHIAIAFIAAAALAGCASSGPKKTQAVAKSASGEGNFIVTALDGPALPKGSCGMALWTLDAERPTLIFRAVVEKDAEIAIDGQPMKLELTKVSGAANFGVSESETFQGDGLTAHVTVRFGQGFDGGSYVEHGILSIERTDGWRTVVPAAGIAGCRPK